MKKTSIRRGIILAVSLILYHLLVFLIPFEKTAIFWLSYGFTLAAFFLVTTVVQLSTIMRPDAKSRFYGFPITRIGILYGLLQLILSLVIMALGRWFPWWGAILIYAFAMGFAIICLVSVDAVVEQIHDLDVKLKQDTALMRTLQSKVSHVASQCDNVAVKALADEFRYADPVSSEALTEIEADLSALVDDLQAAVVDGDEAVVQQLCKKTAATLAERSRLCKLNKQ